MRSRPSHWIVPSQKQRDLLGFWFRFSGRCYFPSLFESGSQPIGRNHSNQLVEFDQSKTLDLERKRHVWQYRCRLLSSTLHFGSGKEQLRGQCLSILYPSDESNPWTFEPSRKRPHWRIPSKFSRTFNQFKNPRLEPQFFVWNFAFHVLQLWQDANLGSLLQSI